MLKARIEKSGNIQTTNLDVLILLTDTHKVTKHIQYFVYVILFNQVLPRLELVICTMCGYIDVLNKYIP